MRQRAPFSALAGLGLLLLPAAATAQLAFRLGGLHTDVARDVAVDASGGAVVAGTFRAPSSVDFDPGPGIVELAARGVPDDPAAVDGFIARYDADGRFLWVRTFACDGWDAPSRVRLDAAGHVFVAGAFSGRADFGDGHPLDAGTGRDAFVAKYDPSGRCLWAARLGDAEPAPAGGDDVRFEEAWDVVANARGDVFLAGVFQGALTLRSRKVVSAAGSRAGFVVRYDPDGRLRESVVLDGPGRDEIRALALLPDGSLAAAGIFSRTVELESGSAAVSAGGTDLFLARVDLARNRFSWFRAAGGPEDDSVAPGGLAADASGFLYLTGRFSGTADLDPGPARLDLAAAGDSDAFVARFGPAGALTWAFAVGSAGADAGLRVALDPAGDAFVGGEFRGPADFDPGPGQAVLVPRGGSDGDAFLAKYGPDGALAWARGFGGLPDGDSPQTAGGVAADPAGNVALAATFHGTADVDPNPAGEVPLTSAGRSDLLLARFEPAGALADARLFYPPLDFSGRRTFNRSVSQVEYVDILTWAPNPNDPGAVRYRVARLADGVRTVLAEVDAATLTWWNRQVDPAQEYVYVLTALDAAGREGRAATATVR